MLSINFILGKPERQQLPSDKSTSRPLAYSEGDGVVDPPIGPTGHPTTYYANAKIFSKRTQRDETQAVGKLYKGYIDD